MTINRLRSSLEYRLGSAILTFGMSNMPHLDAICQSQKGDYYGQKNNGGGGATYPIDSELVNDYAIKHYIVECNIHTNTLKSIYRLRKARNTYRKYKKYYDMIHEIDNDNTPGEVLLKYDSQEFLPSYIFRIAGMQDAITYCIGRVIINHKQIWYKGDFYHAIYHARLRLDCFKRAFFLQSKIYWHVKGYPKELFYNAFNFIDCDSNTLDYIQNRLDSIIAWITSQDFKQYIESKCPYPPLLDPSNIDYDSISAHCAFALNIPLPNHYDFIVCTRVLSGHYALRAFLQKCINIIDCGSHISDRYAYVQCYNTLLKHRNIRNAIYYVHHTETRDTTKLSHLMYRNKDIVCLVRDPISRLKSAINHWESSEDSKNMFNLTFDCDLLVRYWMWYRSGIVPDLATFLCRDFMLQYKWLQVDSYFSTLGGSVTYIDTMGIMGDKTIDTMKFLAEKFHFTIPNDREFFLAKSGGVIGYMMMCNDKVLYVHDSDLGKHGHDASSLNRPGGYKIYFKLILDLEKDGLITVNNIFFEKGAWFDNVLIKMQQQDIDKLLSNKALFNATKTYLESLYIALKKRIALEEAKMIDEYDIINFIKRSGQLTHTKKILAKARRNIAKARPDIVQSWTYYNALMNMD